MVVTSCNFDRSIIFYCSSQNFVIQGGKLSFITENNGLLACFLEFLITLEDFQKIASQELFQFKQNLYWFKNDLFFIPDAKIGVKLAVNPTLLSDLFSCCANVEEGVNYLWRLNQVSTDASLLFQENWFLLYLEQNQSELVVFCHTFWGCLDWEKLRITSALYSEICQGFVNLFNNEDFIHAEENGDSREIAKIFSYLGSVDWQRQKNDDLDELGKKINDYFSIVKVNSSKTVNDGFTIIPLVKNIEKVKRVDLLDSSLLLAIKNFLKAEKFLFFQIKNQPIISTYFQGKNGKWDCYILVRETEKQVIFYSLFPFKVAEDERFVVAEFITRANYDMITGNFELDFRDGELRYKTSLNVPESGLNTALTSQLIYVNVLTMDRYLPGLISILYGNASPKEAIAQIESSIED